MSLADGHSAGRENVIWWTAGQHPTVPTIDIPTCSCYCLLFVLLLPLALSRLFSLSPRRISLIRTFFSASCRAPLDVFLFVLTPPTPRPRPPPGPLHTVLPVNPAHASRLLRPPGREGWQKPGREAAGGLRETLRRPERLLRYANRVLRCGRRPPSWYRGGKGARREREKYRGGWRHPPRTR